MSYKKVLLLSFIFAIAIHTPLYAQNGTANTFFELSIDESVEIALNNAAHKKKLGHIEKARIIYQTRVAFFAIDKLQSEIETYSNYSAQVDKHYNTIQELYEKGLLSKVDLLQVKAALANAELQKLAITEQYNLEEIAFNTLLNRISHAPLGTKPFPNVVRKFATFEHWLHYIARKTKKELQKKDVKQNDELLEDEKARMLTLFTTIANKHAQIELCKNVIDRNEKILQLKQARFKNALTTSSDVIGAIDTLLHAQVQYLDILFTYHATMAKAKQEYAHLYIL